MRDLIAGATVYLKPGSPESAKPTLLLDCDRAEEMAMPERSAVLHLGLCPTRGREYVADFLSIECILLQTLALCQIIPIL